MLLSGPLPKCLSCANKIVGNPDFSGSAVVFSTKSCM